MSDSLRKGSNLIMARARPQGRLLRRDNLLTYLQEDNCSDRDSRLMRYGNGVDFKTHPFRPHMCTPDDVPVKLLLCLFHFQAGTFVVLCRLETETPVFNDLINDVKFQKDSERSLLPATIYGAYKSTPHIALFTQICDLKTESESNSAVPCSCINTGSTVLLQSSSDIPLLLMRAGRTLRMLGLFGVSQVDAVSVLGTINKDKAPVPDDWRAAALDGRTGRGAIS